MKRIALANMLIAKNTEFVASALNIIERGMKNLLV